jgi:hypothetical protein
MRKISVRIGDLLADIRILGLPNTKQEGKPLDCDVKW